MLQKKICSWRKGPKRGPHPGSAQGPRGMSATAAGNGDHPHPPHEEGAARAPPAPSGTGGLDRNCGLTACQAGRALPSGGARHWHEPNARPICQERSTPHLPFGVSFRETLLWATWTPRGRGRPIHFLGVPDSRRGKPIHFCSRAVQNPPFPSRPPNPPKPVSQGGPPGRKRNQPSPGHQTGRPLSEPFVRKRAAFPGARPAL